MNENSYLNPADIRAQCDAAINSLEKDNEATYIIERNLNSFIEDSQVQSYAFKSLKQQMEDYKSVLPVMRMANQADIEDFRFLKLMTTGTELNGSNILEQKNMAIEAKKSDEANAEKYRKKAQKATSVTLRVQYTTKVTSYMAMAALDQKLYDECQKKEDTYDGIEKFTCGLFEEGASIRAAVESALSGIQGAFQNGVYVPDMQAAWRGEISSCYIDRVMTINADGTITTNWAEVRRILNKDAEEITEEEYNALAVLYLNMGEEDLAQFLKLCMDKVEDVDESDWFGIGGTIVNGHSEVDNTDYSVWEINDDKIKNILDRLVVASDETLFMLQKLDSEKDKTVYEEIKDQRNIIIQRSSLLEAMKGESEYRGEYQAEYPSIIIESNEMKDLILKFCQSRSANEFCTAMNNLGESTITVTRTKNGRSITWEEEENMDLSVKAHFGEFSNYSVAGAAEYIAEQIPNKICEDPIGYVPLVGNVLSFVGDSTVGYIEGVKDALFVNGQVKVVEKTNIYRDFDCSASFVYYNTDSSQEQVIYVQGGQKTTEILERVNEKMDLAGTENAITIEQVIAEPNEVRNVINGLYKKNPDYQDRYDEAIQKK